MYIKIKEEDLRGIFTNHISKWVAGEPAKLSVNQAMIDVLSASEQPRK